MNVHPTYRPQNQLLPQGNLSATVPYTFSAKEKDSETLLSYFGTRYYSSDLSIWLSVDPMSAKYPSLSPYVYCANNPIKLVDPNGEKPKIYCETKGTGHVFITTGEGKNTVVYTYGRYLGGGKGKSSANSYDPTGKGVLLCLRGKEAIRYIRHELNDKNAQCYEILDASDSQVDFYFNNLFLNGRPLNGVEVDYYNSKSNKFGIPDNARVIDEYNLFNNNCVSKTIAGTKAGGTKINFLRKQYHYSFFTSPIPTEYTTQPISPASLQKYLQDCSEQNSSCVRNVTNEVNNEF